MIKFFKNHFVFIVVISVIATIITLITVLILKQPYYSEYQPKDVWYNINNKTLSFKVRINDIYEEKNKEDIYIINLIEIEGNSGYDTILQITESKYNQLIGSDNNTVKIKVSTLDFETYHPWFLFWVNGYGFCDDYIHYSLGNEQWFNDNNILDFSLEENEFTVENIKPFLFNSIDNFNKKNCAIWYGKRYTTKKPRTNYINCNEII